MSHLIIYHGHCPDGFTAAWAAAEHLQSDFELHAGQYGKAPPLDLARGKNVLVVDFSYPREQCEELRSVANSIRIFDHHKTAESALAGLDYAMFDMERSGAGITWDELHASERPWVVDYVEDRDLWRFDLPDSRAVSLFVRCCPHDLARWSEMAALPLGAVLEQARGCERYLEHYVQDAAGRSWVSTLFGNRCAVVNLTYTGVSDVLHELLTRHGVDVALGWHVSPSRSIACSLRSTVAVDCSEIARAFGGGGHATASGFVLPSMLELIELGLLPKDEQRR